jgi:hypothetical protein
MREITYLEAVREAMTQEMERDETVFLIGSPRSCLWTSRPWHQSNW